MDFDDAREINIPQPALDAFLASSCTLLKDADLNRRMERDSALRDRAMRLGRDVLVGATLAMTARQTEPLSPIPLPEDAGLQRLGRLMFDLIAEDLPLTPESCGVPRDTMLERFAQLSRAGF